MDRQASIAFQTDKTPAQYRELAALVNQYAFDVVSVYGDLPYQPSYGPLHLMAPLLDRARLGPACVSPSRLTPLDMAGETALLDHLSGGRAFLGIARGAWLERHGLHEATPPVQAVREAIEIVRLLLRGDEAGYAGQVYQIVPGVRLPYPILRPKVPILVGTWGPKLAAVAGELADEVKIGGSANPAMIPLMQRWIAEGERVAGRTPGTVGVVIGAVCVVDEDGRAAKAAVKRDLALYLPVVAGLDQTLTLDPDLLTRIGALVDAGQAEAAAALISDDLLGKFAFAGTPAEVLAQTEALYAAGARRVEFGTPHGLRPGTGIRLLGERVLPHLLP
jgi:5,10-methylenetetrahydromethanopterin reductase